MLTSCAAPGRNCGGKKTELPDDEHLSKIYAEIQQGTVREYTSLKQVSTLIGTGALRAGIHEGQIHFFDYYRYALHTINEEGLHVYTRRVTRPYLAAARRHLDSRNNTHTERLLHQRQRIAEPLENDLKKE